MQTIALGQPDRKWFEDALARSPYSSAAGLSRRLDAPGKKGNTNTIKRLLDGEKQPRVGDLIALADALGVSLATVMEKFGYRWPRRHVPLVATVSERGVVRQLHEPVQIISPGGGTEHTRAMRVDWPGGRVHDVVLYYEEHDGTDDAAYDSRALALLQFVERGEHGVVSGPGAARPLPVVGNIMERVDSDTYIVRTFGDVRIDTFRRLESAQVIRWLRYPVA